MHGQRSKAIGPLAVIAALLLLAGCGKNGQGNASPGPRPGQPASVGVVLHSVSEKSFPYEIEALGTAYANEAMTVTAKVSNIVTAIHFKEGQQVRRGQVLVELDNAEAKAQLAAAEAALSESMSQYKRAQELRATQALSQSELERLEATVLSNKAAVAAAQARVDDTVIRAPFDGRVGLRRVSLGSLVSPGDTITTLDDTRWIKLEFSVPENFISVIREGMTIRARSVAWPDRDFTGKVISIDSRVDPTSRAVLVRALIPNDDGALKPGMFLTVRLQQPRDRVVMIPEEALVPEQGEQFVFVVEDGRTHKRRVEVGRRKPGEAEILSGLAAGEKIVVEGTQLVREGSAVHEIAS